MSAVERVEDPLGDGPPHPRVDSPAVPSPVEAQLTQLRQLRLDRGWHGRRIDARMRRPVAEWVFNTFHCTHDLTNRFCHPEIGPAATAGKSGGILRAFSVSIESKRGSGFLF